MIFFVIQTHPPTPLLRGTADARVLDIENCTLIIEYLKKL